MLLKKLLTYTFLALNIVQYGNSNLAYAQEDDEDEIPLEYIDMAISPKKTMEEMEKNGIDYVLTELKRIKSEGSKEGAFLISNLFKGSVLEKEFLDFSNVILTKLLEELFKEPEETQKSVAKIIFEYVNSMPISDQFKGIDEIFELIKAKSIIYPFFLGQLFLKSNDTVQANYYFNHVLEKAAQSDNASDHFIAGITLRIKANIEINKAIQLDPMYNVLSQKFLNLVCNSTID